MLTIAKLKREVGRLNFELEGMIKFMWMVNFGAGNLNVVFNVGKLVKNMKGLGCTCELHIHWKSELKFMNSIRKMALK